MIKFIQILFISFIFSGICNSLASSDEKLPDISKMSKEEIQKLPPEVYRKLPVKEFFKQEGSEKLALGIPYILADALGKLNYFPLPSEKQIREAIKKFQNDIGQPETGELTMGQLEELQLRSTRITDTPVYLPGFGDELKVYGYSDFVSTEGTWIIEGENIYNPINHSKVNCYKSQGTCEVMQAFTDIPKVTGKGLLGMIQESYTLRMTKDTFKVISWSDSEVISKGGAKCRTTIMTINIKNNEVFQITRNKGDNECDGGIVRLPQLEKPRISRLIPGYKFSYEFWSNRTKEIRKYRSSDYLRLAEENFKTPKIAKGEKQKKADTYSKGEGKLQTDVQAEYARMVQEKIYRNWRDPLAESHSREAVVSFHIFPQGTIDRPFIKQSSGVKGLDALAVDAVLDSAPFPPFPKELKMSNLFLSIYFKYVPKLENPITEGKIQPHPLKYPDNYPTP